MHRVVIVTSSVALVVLGVVLGDGPGRTCPVSEKISQLLTGWKAAAEEGKSLPADEREKLHSRLASLAKECPVGSRMGPTLVLARDVLGSLESYCEEHSKSCPLANASPELKKTEAYVSGEALVSAQKSLSRDLHQLATYAAGCDSKCCAAEAKAGAETAVATAASPEGQPSSCPKELATRIGALKASWATVGDDLAKLPAAKKEELKTSFGALSKSCKALSLMPPTVPALSEGFDALDALHGKLADWAQAHPEIMKSVPEDGKKSFEEQLALLRDTGAILRRAAETLKAMENPKGETTAARETTASKS